MPTAGLHLAPFRHQRLRRGADDRTADCRGTTFVDGRDTSYASIWVYNGSNPSYTNIWIHVMAVTRRLRTTFDGAPCDVGGAGLNVFTVIVGGCARRSMPLNCGRPAGVALSISHLYPAPKHNGGTVTPDVRAPEGSRVSEVE